MSDIKAGTKSHSRMGASGAKRWLNCPGSVQVISKLPPAAFEESNFHADQGTAAHEVCAMCLTEGRDAIEFLDRAIVVDKNKFIVDEEMVEAVQLYLDTVRAEIVASDGDELFVEKSFSLSALKPPEEMGGTADAVIYKAKQRRLVVIDFKYGAGVIVEAKGNDQGRYYGLGAALELRNKSVSTIEIVIVQPRGFHPDGPVRRETVGALDLLDWSAKLLDTARVAATDPNAPLVAGPWCRSNFCPAASRCPAFRDKALAESQMEFSPEFEIAKDERKDPAAMTPEELSKILGVTYMIEGWISSVRQQAFDLLRSGVPVPGYKVVEKRGRRHWNIEDETKLLTELAMTTGLSLDQLFIRKPKSPAQVDKLLKKPDRKLIEAFWDKRSSGYTFAPENDPRPQATVDGGASEFEALDGEQVW